MKNENIAISYLRAFVTLLVLAHHSILAYIHSAPNPASSFISKPYFWTAFPIVDTERWAGFDLFAAFNDTYFMSLMFFLSGLFVWQGLVRKGIRRYLRDRFVRLGIPFICATLILMPIAYYPAYLSRGGEPSILTYLQQWHSLDIVPSGPAWFIAALLVFDVIAVFWYWLSPSHVNGLAKLFFKYGDNPTYFYFGLAGVSAISIITMGLAFGPTKWFTFGPFAIQASRILLYLIYFILGIGIGVTPLDKGPLRQDAKFVRRWALWVGAALVVFTLLVYLVMHIRRLGATAPLPLKLMLGLAFALSCTAICFFMLSAFIHFTNRSLSAMNSLSSNAYGMYLVHYIFVIWGQYYLLNVPLSGWQKGVLVTTITIALSWIATASFRKVPKIDRVLSNGKSTESSHSQFDTDAARQST